MLCAFITTEYRNATEGQTNGDGQTDGQKSHTSIVCDKRRC